MIYNLGPRTIYQTEIENIEMCELAVRIMRYFCIRIDIYSTLHPINVDWYRYTVSLCIADTHKTQAVEKVFQEQTFKRMNPSRRRLSFSTWWSAASLFCPNRERGATFVHLDSYHALTL